MTVRIERADRGYRLHAQVRLASPIGEVFPFFADARNLDRLTPPSLRFEILTPGEIEMAPGTLIDYRIRLRAVPMRWRTRITEWDPPHGFADEQLRGPYRWWIHRHRFTPDGDGTIMTDTVDYAVPGGPLAPLAHTLLVRRDVERIFRYRSAAIGEIFR
ncbi:MAG: SRPBCC family protein [Phycisphaerales bacterium]|nr:SRPBCC family protein [Phycisphaerales bacterium]